DSTQVIPGDYRIESVTFSSLRGIIDPTSDGIPFGLNFVRNGEIYNALILAHNATGKSSIFAGLEMIYAQEVSEKLLRSTDKNFKKQAYYDYLKRFGSALDPQCEIKTQAGTFNLKDLMFPDSNVLKLVAPGNHFISDYDIYEYGKKDFYGDSENESSFHYLIANSLGLGDFMKMRDTYRKLAKYNRTIERAILADLEKDRANLEITTTSRRETLASKREQLKVLQSERNPSERSSESSAEYKQLKQLQAKSLGFDVSANEFRKTVNTFLKLYTDSLAFAKNQSTVKEQSFLESGLELAHVFDECPFCRASQQSTQEMVRAVEKRLAMLKDSLQREDALEQAYTAAHNMVRRFYVESSVFYENLTRERVEVSQLRLLGELGSLLEWLYVRLSPIANDETMRSYLNSPATKTNDRRHEYLYNIINNNNWGNSSELIQRIAEFKDQRGVELEAALLRLEARQGSQLSRAQREAILEKEISDDNSQLERDLKTLIETQKTIGVLNRDIRTMSQMKVELEQFIAELNLRIDSMIQEVFDPVRSHLEEIMNQFMWEKGVKFSVRNSERTVITEDEPTQTGVMVAVLERDATTDSGPRYITPDRYFNTFRYKLFCLTVSLSMALINRRRYKINLPLVIDDVFFGSDFISKTMFTDFLKRVIEVFHTFGGDMPSQFILFTHDEVIYQSAMEAVARTRIGKEHILESTITGKLFPPDDRAKEYTVLQDGTRFWDLFYPIPNPYEFENKPVMQ
ncbi:MAG TPA: hypothetical protein PKV24_21625, partial [Cyclobacteriaceae bacterium]|nr:hypothetical protein [Cyclobacteriaceae bacterium]